MNGIRDQIIWAEGDLSRVCAGDEGTQGGEIRDPIFCDLIWSAIWMANKGAIVTKREVLSVRSSLRLP